MALIGQAVSEEKIFEIVDGRTDDGRTPDHGHPISSPCEPNGSGELKMGLKGYSLHGHVFMMEQMYCLSTFFRNLISYFSETPQENNDHVIFLQPKS